MSVLRFVVDGKPQTWKRAGRNGEGSYTVTSMKAYQRVVQWAARAARIQRVTPVALLVRCSFARPKDKSRHVPDSNRYGDVDNLGKNIMDALQEMAYKDDGEVLLLVASKEFCEPGKLPRTEVQIVPLTRLEAWSVRVGRLHAIAAKLIEGGS